VGFCGIANGLLGGKGLLSCPVGQEVEGETSPTTTRKKGEETTMRLDFRIWKNLSFSYYPFDFSWRKC
jgi:hypothetical protein